MTARRRGLDLRTGFRANALARWCRAGAVCLLVAGAFASTNPSGEIKFIVNPSVTVSNLTTEEMRRVFLIKTSSLPDGSHVEPVIGKGSPAYEIFLKQYMGKNDSALTTYYLSLVFTGKALMPKLLNSDAEVIAYVTRTKGTMGYVVASAHTPGLRSFSLK